jgi:hypothetical protein
MNAFRRSCLAWASIAVLASDARAVCWEIAFRVQSDAGGWVSTPIEIYDQCNLVWSGSSSSMPDAQGVNFRIDLNSNCPGMPQLTPDVVYRVRMPAWSKAFFLEGHLMPGSPVDDIFTLRPSSLTHYLGPQVQEVWGYPNAQTLCMTLVVYETIPVGDKTTYKLRATASGAPSYSFAWTNASMTTGATTNPSLAQRTKLNTQTVTVSCTVNGTLTKSIVLQGLVPAPKVPATWSRVKALYGD